MKRTVYCAASVLTIAICIDTGALMATTPATSASSTVPSVSLGRHAKISAQSGDRARITSFYRDALGCEVTSERNRDRVHLGGDYFITIVYDASAPATSESSGAIWLEIQTDQPEALRNRILAHGGRSIASPDPTHFIFAAPGGQIYRVVGVHEDLSRFEK